MGLETLKNGDRLIIRHENGELTGIGVCVGVNSMTRCISCPGIGSSLYSATTGIRHGGKYVAFIATPTEIIDAQAELDWKATEKERIREEQSKKAYDALPEAIKLARSLRYICDHTQEEKLAKMPLEILRPVVEWLRLNVGDD